MNKLLISILMCSFLSCTTEDYFKELSNNQEQLQVTTKAMPMAENNEIYYYTENGISIKNSGMGAETWWGGTNDYVPFMIEYPNVEDSKTAFNSMIRVAWADVEDENGYHFEKKFDDCLFYAYKNKVKVCIGIFPMDSHSYNTVKVSAQYKGKERDAFIGYPKYIHEQLMIAEKYRPRLYQNKDGSITDDTAPLYFAPDLRNPYLYKKYRDLIIAFRRYLDEEVVVDGRKMCRRLLIREIQMRHWGYYGEGLYQYLGPNRETIKDISEFDMESSDDLIKWGEIYTEVFPDIRLIAASNGMWQLLWNKYQYWLATSRNEYGEFGLFYDMWGENTMTALVSSPIVWNGIKLSEILMNKWRKAPIGGEPWTHFPSEGYTPYSTLIKQVKLTRPVKFLAGNLTLGNEPGNTTHWKVTEHESQIFKSAYSMMGFRIIVKNPDYSYLNTGHIRTAFWIQNIGLNPVYEPWDLCYVFRDHKSQKEVAIRKSSHDIRDLMPTEDPENVLKIRENEWSYVREEFFDIPKGRLDVYLKIADPDSIVPNMRLSQPGYNENGEYLIMTISNY